MRHSIFSKKGSVVLAAYLKSKVLIAFDYDGTLAPIVEDPAKAFMRQRTKKLISDIASLFPVVIISGRSRKDLNKFVSSLQLRETIGNHGIEPWQSTDRLKQKVKKIRSQILMLLPRLPGVVLEDKIYSLSLHYRQSRTKKHARDEIIKAAQQLDAVRILGGKQVINIIPEEGPHKGIALQKAMRQFGCDTSIYLGDDITDEDVFNLNVHGEILGIRVGYKMNSSADFFIESQRSVDKFLTLLLSQKLK